MTPKARIFLGSLLVLLFVVMRVSIFVAPSMAPQNMTKILLGPLLLLPGGLLVWHGWRARKRMARAVPNDSQVNTATVKQSTAVAGAVLIGLIITFIIVATRGNVSWNERIGFVRKGVEISELSMTLEIMYEKAPPSYGGGRARTYDPFVYIRMVKGASRVKVESSCEYYWNGHGYYAPMTSTEIIAPNSEVRANTGGASFNDDGTNASNKYSCRLNFSDMNDKIYKVELIEGDLF
jgi:hypothetical protein